MTKNEIWLTAWIALFMFLPPIIFVGTQGSSYSTGLISQALIGAIGCIWFTRSYFVTPRSTLLLVRYGCIIWFVVAIHGFAAAIESNTFDFPRALLTLSSLTAMAFCSLMLAGLIKASRNQALVRLVFILIIVLLMIAVAGSFAPSFGPWSQRDKGLFPFSEPSHFALSAAWPMIALFCLARQKAYFFAVASALLMLAFVSSVTLLSIVLMCFACRTKKRWLFVLAILVTTFFLSPGDLYGLDYYSSRLDVTSESTNLSVLVWLQGWGQAYQSIIRTHGLGLGFQQLGLVTPDLMIVDQIIASAGIELNLLDGGSMAAKLIGEFGLLGCVIVISLTAMVVRSVINLRALARGQNSDPKLILAHSGIAAYGIELYVRGIGYFSPGLFIILISLSLLSTSTHTYRIKRLPLAANGYRLRPN